VSCRHEGFGSPFAVLKARGWATGLNAGEGGSSFSARSFFTVGITLTDEGKCDCIFHLAVGYFSVRYMYKVLFKGSQLLLDCSSDPPHGRM
jgi:secreted Zn-dependent insulinase-like peptidase